MTLQQRHSTDDRDWTTYAYTLSGLVASNVSVSDGAMFVTNLAQNAYALKDMGQWATATRQRMQVVAGNGMVASCNSTGQGGVRFGIFKHSNGQFYYRLWWDGFTTTGDANSDYVAEAPCYESEYQMCVFILTMSGEGVTVSMLRNPTTGLAQDNLWTPSLNQIILALRRRSNNFGGLSSTQGSESSNTYCGFYYTAGGTYGYVVRSTYWALSTWRDPCVPGTTETTTFSDNFSTYTSPYNPNSAQVLGWSVYGGGSGPNNAAFQGTSGYLYCSTAVTIPATFIQSANAPWGAASNQGNPTHIKFLYNSGSPILQFSASGTLNVYINSNANGTFNGVVIGQGAGSKSGETFGTPYAPQVNANQWVHVIYYTIVNQASGERWGMGDQGPFYGMNSAVRVYVNSSSATPSFLSTPQVELLTNAAELVNIGWGCHAYNSFFYISNWSVSHMNGQYSDASGTKNLRGVVTDIMAGSWPLETPYPVMEPTALAYHGTDGTYDHNEVWA